MKPEEFIELYEKYISGLCSPEEEKLLLNNKDSFKIRDDDSKGVDDEGGKDDEVKHKVYNKITNTIHKKEHTKLPSKTVWWAVAAILLITISLSLIFFNYNQLGNTPLLTNTSIKPGKDMALLIFDDGTSIQLDTLKNSVLSKNGKTLIRKADDGTLIYEPEVDVKGNKALSYNTIVIPRGGKYKIKLPDGTWVWLNSESRLTYPSFFSGNERLVELNGEAYFEVAKNKDMPFRVKTGNVNVEVLGTCFNVCSYTSTVKTTLLEGSVKLRNNKNETVVLEPGEQGTNTTNGIDIAKVKVQEVVAWKEGYFVFRDNTISEIMDQIKRWYDVDIEYKGNPIPHVFGGVYSKNKELPELLKGLELTGLVHFKVEGRRIIVMP